MFATTDFTHFQLPIGSFSQFQGLIRSFDSIETLPGDIQLLANTDIWDSQSGERLRVKPRDAPELSARSAEGLSVVFNYANYISGNGRLVEVQTTFASPPKALSVHFSYSSNAEPFRLLIFNKNKPPPAVHLRARWRQAGLGDLLIGKFTFLQGPQLQLLSSKDLKDEIARLDQTLGRLATTGDYPLGKDLGLPDRLASFTKWARSPPTQVLFVSYLGQLGEEGVSSNAWVKDWPPLFSSDDDETLKNKFQILYNLWIQNFPAAKTNADFTNYFYTTWLKLKDLEDARQSQKRIAEEANAVVDDGLFITHPSQPGPPVEVFRFDLP